MQFRAILGAIIKILLTTLIKKLYDLIGLRFIKEPRKNLGIIALNCVLRSCMEKKVRVCRDFGLGMEIERNFFCFFPDESS